MPDHTVADTSLLLSIAIKVCGLFLAFVSGVITATWVVANKLNGYDDRLRFVESAQAKCQNETLGEIKQNLERINTKLDDIPGVIDDKLNRTHKRIDDLILHGQDNDDNRKN